jgi:phosphohistidine swiveling domain-containing protein
MMSTTESAHEHVISLLDLRATQPSLAGGKASVLARLARAGHPVPAGYVVTPSSFVWAAPDALDGGGHGEPRLSPQARTELDLVLQLMGDRVAVRSSGIAEDRAEASFAGQYETVLDVEGLLAVELAILSCVQSARSLRVLAYRATRRVDAAPMAVLVQRMVRARAAGVAFTAHPITGERGVTVLSAVAGLGESLVSGLSNAEEWEIRGAPLRRRGQLEVLSPHEAAAIGRLANDVAGDAPTDVEWALTGPRHAPAVSLLQARPMTALPAALSWEPGAPGGYIRNFRLGEWIGAPVTPLFESWMLTDLEEALHADLEALMGLRSPRPLHVVVNGWYFYGGLNYQPEPLALLGALPRIARSCASSARRAQLFTVIPPLASLGFERELSRWRETTLPGLRALVARAAGEVEHATPPRLMALVQELVDETARQVCSIVGVAGYAAKAEGRLVEFWNVHLGAHPGSSFELVSGARVAPEAHDVEGLDPVFPTLGERGPLPPGPSDEQVSRALERRDEAERRALAALPPRLRRRFSALVTEARRAHAARLEQTSVLTLGWPVLRRALLRLGASLVEARHLVRSEHVFFLTRSELTEAVGGQSRAAPGELASLVDARRATWQRQRRLSPPLVIGAPTGLLKDVTELFSRLLRHDEHDAPDALVGMPGSPGRVSGVARVVLGLDELDRLLPGEILVAPITTPAWTLAFGRALAIVTDTGSVASHASIVAREYGIPAVVGVGQATTKIVDGQRITVDGGRGVVRLAAAPEPPTTTGTAP